MAARRAKEEIKIYTSLTVEEMEDDLRYALEKLLICIMIKSISYEW